MSVRFEGHHDEHELPIKRGDVVTIRKGTPIRTTSPGMNGAYRHKIAGRTYKIKVDHILNGTNRPVGHKGHNASYPVHNPSVRWPGAGGYWYSVDLNLIPEAQPPGHCDNGLQCIESGPIKSCICLCAGCSATKSATFTAALAAR